MKDEFIITRWPNPSGLMRGPNMLVKFCQKCEQDKTHGFQLHDPRVLICSIFICDDCFNNTRKAVK